ncbi:MAG: phage holin family protein [Clostridia bacterium]
MDTIGFYGHEVDGEMQRTSQIADNVIANEGLSILENAGELGLPLPGALKKALEKLKTDSGEPKNI